MVMNIEQFLQKADQVAAQNGWTRSTLSRKLFGSGARIDQLHNGADVASRRLTKAIGDLETLSDTARQGN